ncbi:MAG: hypothetical protein ACE5HO_11320 [bacterium]
MYTEPGMKMRSEQRCQREDSLAIFALTDEPPPWSAEALLQPLKGSKAQARLAHSKAGSIPNVSLEPTACTVVSISLPRFTKLLTLRLLLFVLIDL